MIGRKHRRQEDCEKASQPEQDAVKKLPVARLQFVVDRLPKIHAGEPFRRHFGNVSDRLARLQRDAEDVRAVVLNPLRHETQRRRHGFDAAGVEVGPDRPRPEHGVALGSQPALDWLIGRILKGKCDPGRVGARRDRAHGHAPGDGIGGCHHVKLQTIPAAVIEFAKRRNFDAILIRRDRNRFERHGRRGEACHERQERDQQRAENR